MSVVGLDGRWLRINRAYARMLGYEPVELIGRRFSDFTHPGDVDVDRKFIAGALAGGVETQTGDKRYLQRDGSVIAMNASVELIRDAAGAPLYFVSHLHDLARQHAAQESARDTERTLRSVIDNTPAMISVKGPDFRYQLVNREFERFFGVSSSWIVGRGDANILPEADLAGVRAADLRVLAGETVQEEETKLRNGSDRTFLTVRFPLADDRGGVRAICVASTDITERRQQERAAQERAECAALVHSALSQHRFVLHGQPIVNLSAMQPAKAELLIRMLKVRGGEELVAPRAFLPAAERFGLIQVIDEWVVERAIELAALGHHVAVNVSANTISDRLRVDGIERAILASEAPPGNLTFEITETAVADNLHAARAFATGLRVLGCKLALDDFGVGHGSFTYLRHLPVDYLKIDMQFVRNLLSSDEDRHVVEAIVGVARHFDIETIAEGVEDEATLDELRLMNVDYAQGYWIGRPQPLPDLWRNQEGR